MELQNLNNLTNLKFDFTFHCTTQSIVYYHFTVQSQDGQVNLLLNDRFSNFHRFNEKIKQKYKQFKTALPQFPKKTLINHLSHSQIEKRQEKLEIYFEQLSQFINEDVQQDLVSYILDLIDKSEGISSKQQPKTLSKPLTQKIKQQNRGSRQQNALFKSQICITQSQNIETQFLISRSLESDKSPIQLALKDDGLEQDLFQDLLIMQDMSTKESENKQQLNQNERIQEINNFNSHHSLNQAPRFNSSQFKENCHKILLEFKTSLLDLNIHDESESEYIRREKISRYMKSQLKVVDIQQESQDMQIFQIPIGSDSNLKLLNQNDINIMYERDILGTNLNDIDKLMNSHLIQEFKLVL